MDHEQAARILPDYAEGVIDSGDAAAVEHHLASCGECRDSLSLLRRIAMEIAATGAPLFDDHPEAAQLVDYSLVRARVSDADLKRIDLHVRSCPTCAQEVIAVRSAESWSRAPWRGIAEAFRGGIAPLPVPTLATALLALLLVRPAYLGLVQLPKVALERNQAIEALAMREVPSEDIARLEARIEELTRRESSRAPVDAPRAAARRWEGGPIATLALAGVTRSASETGEESPLPTVHLRSQQPFLPVRIDFNISTWSAEQVVVLTLRELNSPQQLWRHSGSAAQIWDPVDEAINLLLPADALDAGTYTLEIAKEGSPDAAYSADFAVEE